MPRHSAAARVAAGAAALGLFLLWLPVPARAHRGHRDRTWSASKENTLRRTLTFAGGAGGRSLVVDNYEGAVTVDGRAGGEIELVVHQKYSGESQEKLAEAEREVKLEVRQNGNQIEIYADGPFRCKGEGSDCCCDSHRRDQHFQGDFHGWNQHFHGWDRLGYEAHFDFELHVPAALDFSVSTVEGGDVRVRNVRGRFEARNVNGGIEMSGLAGAGSARTVNGPVRVSFDRNPDGGCEFHSVNGRVEVGFKTGLAADLRFKTMNGEVYSDFPYTYRALPAEKAEQRHGKYVYRSRGGFAVRIAGGGPEMAFSTINGDILIRNQDL